MLAYDPVQPEGVVVPLHPLVPGAGKSCVTALIVFGLGIQFSNLMLYNTVLIAAAPSVG